MVRKKSKKKLTSSKNSSDKRVALVCDWLTNVGGAEKVLLELHQMFPEAPIYTSKYDPSGIDWFKDADIRTGKLLQKFPSGLRRILGPLRQRYFSRLDLSEYDLIISVTGAEAKAVKSGKWLFDHGKKSANPKGIHISYCHVPTQYYWQMYKDYIKNPGFGFFNPIIRLLFRIMIRPLRRADRRAAKRPDYFVTISEYAKEMIFKYYKRDAIVVHPPVEVDIFREFSDGAFRARSRSGPSLRAERSSRLGRDLRQIPQNTIRELSNYYITTSRQVNWKRIDLAVRACLMTQRKLLVIGDGPEHKKLVKMAQGTKLIEFLPTMKREELAKYLAGAKGYLFPSLEPFGIAPVEALASGVPVIAYKKGGALDYIEEGKNGIFFENQTAKSLAEAILKFEKIKFNRKKIEKSVEKFDVKRFDKEMEKFINEKLK